MSADLSAEMLCGGDTIRYDTYGLIRYDTAGESLTCAENPTMVSLIRCTEPKKRKNKKKKNQKENRT